MPLPPEVRIRTDADLTHAWQMLRGRLRFRDLALWLLVVDGGGRPGPLLALAGLPDGPYDLGRDHLAELVGDILAYRPGNEVAVLYGRPGGGPWHLGDRAWVRYLQTASLPVPVRPLHRAHDASLEIVPEPAAVQNRQYG